METDRIEDMTAAEFLRAVGYGAFVGAFVTIAGFVLFCLLAVWVGIGLPTGALVFAAVLVCAVLYVVWRWMRWLVGCLRTWRNGRDAEKRAGDADL